MTPERFIEERKYLHNVSPRTLPWYVQGFKAFAGCETRDAIIRRIGELRERRVAISVNSYTTSQAMPRMNSDTPQEKSDAMDKGAARLHQYAPAYFLSGMYNN